MNTTGQYKRGEKLTLDSSYRRAHLPLVNPTHPDVITTDGDYRSGTYHSRRHSLVLPIDDKRLRMASAFAEINNALYSSSLSGKIAWELAEKRKSLLHATISSGLRPDNSALAESVRLFINAPAVKKYRLGGLFMGPVNTGRLYFKVYPQVTDRGHIFREIQLLAGLKETPFFLVGYYHLTDHLTLKETQELAVILERYQHETLWEEEICELWLLSTSDDLVLSGEITHRIVKAV